LNIEQKVKYMDGKMSIAFQSSPLIEMVNGINIG